MARLTYIICFAAFLLTSCQNNNNCLPVTTDPAANKAQFLGDWYEIGSIPQFFNIGCNCTKATYTDNGSTILVTNSCRLGGATIGVPNEINGTAFAPNPNDFSKLKVTLGGGMAVQRAVAEKWKQVTGKPLIEAYGLTETSPAATINPLDIPAYTGAIGLPISSTEVAIRNDAGVDVPLGERGELCIRGPQVMKGYYNRPEETAKVIMPDGFLLTGDIAVMDETGFVRIVDRKKDMILVSGFNVYPNEVEDVVAQHPGVLEVAAVGVPHDKSGEAVKIFVVKKDPALTAEALIAHCREHLTGYKVPGQVEFRAELPKTNVGKILRRELRDEALQKA